jgi:hypothetical protein
MRREKAQVAKTARLKVPMRRLEADCFVRFTRARGAAERGAANLGRALDRAAGRFLFGEFFLT